MSFNTSLLTAYVEQQNYPLLSKSLFGSKTFGLFRKQPGVKGSATINILDNDVVVQAGACGFNASGSTTLSQRTIVTAFMKVDKKFCPDDLRGFYLQAQLQPGNYEEQIPYEQQFSEQQAALVSQTVETQLWQSDKLSAAANMSYFDGFVKVISGSGAQPVSANGYITGSYHYSSSAGGAVALSGSAVISAVDGVWTAIPANVIDKDDVRVIVGRDVFTLYQIALKNQNLYNYPVNADSNQELTIPGSAIKMVALNGLNGTFRIFAGRLSNFVIGIDLEEPGSKYKMWWDESNQEVRFTLKYTLGVNVAFPNEIVYAFNGQ